MNILVTNDDGYQAEGIKVLAAKLAERHNVYVLAPDGNRSAVSSHICMYTQMQVKKLSENLWTCSGFPADCVVTGIKSNLFDVKFDAVVSGINRGSNLGTDIVYSGTCASARQAALYHLPGIAVSLDVVDWSKIDIEPMHYDALAEFVSKNVEKFADLLAKKDYKYFLNVNAVSSDKYSGVEWAEELCIRQYEDRMDICAADENSSEVKTAKLVPGQGATLGTAKADFNLCRNNYISLSLVFTQPVCAELSETVDCKDFSL